MVTKNFAVIVNKMQIINGNCLDIMKTLPENSVDSIVCDPPYGLSFMGKNWDYDVPSVEIWKECFRVLKPGGYLLSFAGTRTQHRMAVNIEDAGFEIRDMIAWVYGSGFPKSLNIGKAVDKVSERLGQSGGDITKGNSEWEGWGTALKPALEPITVARKPLSEKTVAENVLKWGTGGINIDGSRVGTEEITQRLATVDGGTAIGAKAVGVKQKATGETTTTTGRFPANLIHDGSDEVVSLFPNSNSSATKRNRNTVGSFGMPNDNTPEYGDKGSASRFFYCAKASKADRDEGLEGREEVEITGGGGTYNREAGRKFGSIKTAKRNTHPTVKPTKLMQYLVKLVTPKGGTVLDPFMGSGSTGKACKLEGFDFIGIELEEEYHAIAKARIEAVKPNKQGVLAI